MVKLTIDMMVRDSNGKMRKKKEEPISQFLNKLTHLYLEGKGIDEIDKELTSCPKLTCLYLYDNLISCIPNLNINEDITQLYLHNNNITKMENLGNLRHLSKLFIGFNKLIVLEGLENCSTLKELHIENQKLEEGEFLVIDPRSISSISATLEVLDISGNGLESLEAIKECLYLRDLSAHHNQLSDMADTVDQLSNKTSLTKLDLAQNPITSQPKYRNKIIVICNNLESLDGKEVSAVSRNFLRNWQNSKDTIQLKSQQKNTTNNNNTEECFNAEPIHGDSFSTSTYKVNFIHPSYVLPAFPTSSKRKLNKLHSNVTKHESNSNYSTGHINHSLNGFLIKGSSSSNPGGYQ